VDRGEGHGRGPDAEAHGSDDDGGDQGRAPQPPQRHAQVLQHIVEHQPPLHALLLPLVLLTAVPSRLFEIAELPPGLAACFFRRHPALDQLPGPHLEMKRQLFVDLGLHRLAAAAQVPEGAALVMRLAHAAPISPRGRLRRRGSSGARPPSPP
jgi:hypothetical protein